MAVGWLIALVMSVVPAFMPPMWLVLSAFHVGTGAPLLPLALGAAPAGAIGRAILALLSRKVGPRLPRTTRRDSAALGRWFGRRGNRKWLAVAAYCLGPFPSNALFISAGTTSISIRKVAVVYAATRAVSDTFWVWTATNVVSDVRGALAGSYTDWVWIVGQVAGLLLILAAFRLPWARWLEPHD